MRIPLQDGCYLETQRSRDPNKVWIIIGTHNKDNPLELLLQTAEVQKEKLLEAIASETGPKMVQQ